ncbi:MAG: tetratricopeptide repeat protein [Opitutaceae bacterium]|nr:tetratricopeptide repeat protein [Opitutaceae bacterium]
MPSVHLPALHAAEQELLAGWDTRELDSPRLQRAVAAARSLLAETKAEDPAVARLAGWSNLGAAYGYLLSADFGKALDESVAAAGQLTAAGDEFGTAWAGVVRATAHFYLCRYADGVSHAEAALGQFERIGDLRGQSGALTAIANICRVNGQPARALRCARLSLERAQACGHAPSEAVVLNNLGTIAHSLGDFAQAVTYFERALHLARRIGHHRIEMPALNNLGASCEAAGDVAAALEWHRQSLALKEKRGDRRGRAISLNNLGIALKKLGRLDEALEHQERSLALFLEVDDRWGQAYCHQEFGALAVARGDFTEARRQAERALELRRAMGDRLLEAEAILTLADLLLDHPAGPGETDRARELAESALAIGRESSATGIQLNAQKVLHRAAKIAHDLPAALEHCEAVMELEHRSSTQEADQKLKNLRVLHEVEAAQRQLEAEQHRSRELQAALEQAEQHRRRATEADEYKSEVLRIVAHDLRSPVAAIRSLADLVAERHPGDAETAEFSAMISRSADSVLGMVGNLLDAAALEEGRMAAMLRPLDLRPLLTELARLHEAQIRAKHQRIELRLEGDLSCTGDPQLLTTAVANLLSNASKFSPDGSCVRLLAARGPAGEIRLAVQDEGPGLTAEDRIRLFGKFARLSARPTAGEGSSGLGLYIVRQLVALHHGRTWAESAGPGHGSTFFIALPAG